MANLNFQQPPRSIASSSLAGRSSSGFGGSSLSGHVTPTSGIFPPGSIFESGGSYGQSQPQLSPNRNAQLSVGGGGGPQQLSSSGRANIFGQRTFPDRRTMQGLGGGPMSNMGSFVQSSRGGYGSGGGVGGIGGSGSGSALNNFHSVFGGGAGDTATPPLLDLSEFPSLTNARGQNDQSLPQSNPLQPPGSKPYVGMVKQPTAEQSEFTMSNEDFPALPGTQITDGTTNQGVVGGLTGSLGGVVGSGIGGGIGDIGGVNNSSSSGSNTTTSSSLMSDNKGSNAANSIGMDLQSIDSHNSSNFSDKSSMKRGVQTSPDGKVTNIPASMVNNQFGMVGLLTFIRAAESDPNLVTLAMGQDLTGLGLNLNSQESLHPTFAGPFADQPCRPQDIEYNVPPEYLVNFSIRDKLSTLQLKKYKDDLLFFLFYTNVGDVMQVMAAAELHSREWRYHIDEKVWITRIPGITHYEKSGTKERGTFYYFDAQNWRRVPKDFQIDAEKLDKCPNINALVNLNNGQPV